MTAPRVPFGAFPVEGEVGLYRLEFAVPQWPLARRLPKCDPNIGVYSNVTVTFYGLASFDGGGLCVNPDVQVPFEE